MLQNKHSVSKVKKLIDLNGRLVNFDITFSASCKEGVEFDALVVDQNTLDSKPELEYKKAVNGSLSGHLVSDKNNYQNFFLILKSDTPCEVDVIINKKEIAPQQLPQQLPQQEQYEYSKSLSDKPSMVSKINFKLILLTIVIISGVFFLWYYLNKYVKNKDKMLLVNENLHNSPDLLLKSSLPEFNSCASNIHQKSLGSPIGGTNISPIKPYLNFPPTANANLIDRLNNLTG